MLSFSILFNDFIDNKYNSHPIIIVHSLLHIVKKYLFSFFKTIRNYNYSNNYNNCDN